jgi:hypothetical protein
LGAYADGGLYEWDPSEPWDPPKKADYPKNRDRNPRWLASAKTEIGRPWTVLAHPDERHVVLGGNAGYGENFGGLLIWDRQRESGEILKHDAVVPNQNTYATAPLPNGNFLGGSSTEPAGGGQRKAEVAKLYEMNPSRREIVWSDRPYDDVREYADMIAHDGMVYGVTDPSATNRYFVFDPEDRSIVHESALGRETPYQQGPEVFVPTPDGRLFMLYDEGTIAEVDTKSYERTDVASVPTDETITNGGSYREGRLYFCGGPHLYSWSVPSGN